MKTTTLLANLIVIAWLVESATPGVALSLPTYANDFSSPVGPEWSAATTSTTPLGARKFLGEFGKGTVSLNLTGLPVHSAVDLSFDLFLIRTWDGNNSDFGINGPDVFQVKIDGGPTLLNSTFSNVYYFTGFNQSFPNPAGLGDFAPFTGASEVRTLGYFEPGGRPDDSVYHFDFVFPHTGSALAADFVSLQSEAITNESWGLDNVVVSTVPEPSTLTMCMLGAVCAFFIRRMRAAMKVSESGRSRLWPAVSLPTFDDRLSRHS